MEQATKLSPAERTAIAVALSKMAGDAFGSLATLPLFCLGELHSPDPERAVSEHYDVWRSCLVVVREVLRGAGFGNELPITFSDLSDCVAGIRDAYLEILRDHTTNPQKALAAYALLEERYEALPTAVRDLGVAVDVDTAFPPGENSLKKVSYDRSLRWFGQKLRDSATGK